MATTAGLLVLLGKGHEGMNRQEEGPGVDILQRDIITDAYLIVEDLIRHMVWKFISRYGGDFDDWLSEANDIFMEVIYEHNPDKAGLVTLLYHKLHWGLYNKLAERNLGKRVRCVDTKEVGVIIRAKGGSVVLALEDGSKRTLSLRKVEFAEPVTFGVLDADPEARPDEIIPAPQTQTITTLIDHVSDSSRELWELILDPPRELRDALDKEDPSASWDALHRYCEWTLRWTVREMKIAIKELRELCTE